MLAKDIVSDFETFKRIVKERYEHHQAQGLPDVVKIGRTDISWLSDDIMGLVTDQVFFADRTGDVSRVVTEYQKDCRLETFQLPHQGEILNHFSQLWSWNRAAGYVYCQPPNRVTNAHVDLLRSLFRDYPDDHDVILEKDIRRRAVFLTDWHHGQVFCFGRETVVDWRRGDVIEFPWYMEHSMANASEYRRCIITITGTVN